MYSGQKYTQHYWGTKQYRELPFSFHIAGSMKYYANVSEALQIGERQTFKADPDNKYDGNAIKIENSKGELCGYVPSNDISTVSKYISRQECFLEVTKKNEHYITVVLHDLNSKFSGSFL